jgi:hypothetical protein
MDEEQRDPNDPNGEDRARPKPRVVDKRFSARPEGAAPAKKAPPKAVPAPEPEAAPAPTTPEVTQPPPASDPSAAPERPVWTPEQEAEARRMAEEIAAVHAQDWVVSSAMNLVNVAGVKLETGPLEEAGLTIDALAALIKEVGPRLGDAEGPLRGVLSQLQLAYAQLAAAPPK